MRVYLFFIVIIPLRLISIFWFHNEHCKVTKKSLALSIPIRKSVSVGVPEVFTVLIEVTRGGPIYFALEKVWTLQNGRGNPLDREMGDSSV